jgi:hypothetical protein
MAIHHYIKLINLIILISILFNSCKKDSEDKGKGNIILHFEHQVNGETLETDTLKYVNAAGNPYLVSEIQYFISDVMLYNADGSSTLIHEWKDIHYVDTDLPETQTWDVFDEIAAGHYDSIAFTFGISQAKNISFMFVNPPESYMFWPDFLGGGYHYMKLNGKWREQGQSSQTTPFNCHLGIGQIYYSYPDSIIGFIHNDFRVSLPGSFFVIESGKTTKINLTMNIEQWFVDPHIYNFDVFGSYTMQNQESMGALRDNGHNVFSVIIE